MDYNHLCKEIGSIIKNARKARNLRQEDLAEAVGISKSHVCGIENAKVAPSLKTICKISEVLGVDIISTK